MFTVDGTQWTFPCDIERESEVTASEISGMLLNKNYFNDVIGTFLRYTVTLVVPIGYEAEYATLYEIITEPVDAHTFVFPYNQGTVTITGRVEDISDVYRRMADGSAHWVGIKFNVLANSPNKTHTFGEAVSRGLTPMPNVAVPQTGVLYEYNGSAWQVATLEDADDTAY